LEVALAEGRRAAREEDPVVARAEVDRRREVLDRAVEVRRPRARTRARQLEAAADEPRIGRRAVRLERGDAGSARLVEAALHLEDLRALDAGAGVARPERRGPLEAAQRARDQLVATALLRRVLAERLELLALAKERLDVGGHVGR